jgi:hypothetical protein
MLTVLSLGVVPVPPCDSRLFCVADPEGPAVEVREGVSELGAAVAKRDRRFSTSPCPPIGAGSIDLRVNLSESEAKHLRAPSETCVSL